MISGSQSIYGIRPGPKQALSARVPCRAEGQERPTADETGTWLLEFWAWLT